LRKEINHVAFKTSGKLLQIVLEEIYEIYLKSVEANHKIAIRSWDGLDNTRILTAYGPQISPDIGVLV
jgi:hypothetical protein